uniref:Uncharacterized protein n=1 Tax=Rhizophora mucronata TaxID=61149 RepID=A0A2P2QCP3_RHIMU
MNFIKFTTVVQSRLDFCAYTFVIKMFNKL